MLVPWPTFFMNSPVFLFFCPFDAIKKRSVAWEWAKGSKYGSHAWRVRVCNFGNIKLLLCERFQRENSFENATSAVTVNCPLAPPPVLGRRGVWETDGDGVRVWVCVTAISHKFQFQIFHVFLIFNIFCKYNFSYLEGKCTKFEIGFLIISYSMYSGSL